MVILEGYEAIGAGLTLGLSSILSIGPNNMMLMREGLRRGQVGWVATAVWLSYLAFFACAFLLAERLSIGGAVMQPILAWSASLVICWFAFRSFRSAFVSDASLKLGVGQRDATVDRVRRAVVAVWLNPLTYVDKFMMPSLVASTFVGVLPRVQFMSGLGFMAAICCYGYTFGSMLCATLFDHRQSLRLFDLLSGCLLSCTAAFTIGTRLMHLT